MQTRVRTCGLAAGKLATLLVVLLVVRVCVLTCVIYLLTTVYQWGRRLNNSVVDFHNNAATVN